MLLKISFHKKHKLTFSFFRLALQRSASKLSASVFNSTSVTTRSTTWSSSQSLIIMEANAHDSRLKKVLLHNSVYFLRSLFSKMATEAKKAKRLTSFDHSFWSHRILMRGLNVFILLSTKIKKRIGEKSLRHRWNFVKHISSKASNFRHKG